MIAFFLLPLIAVTFAALQSEKSLHADTRGLWPPEWTLDNFRVIFSGGAQRGKVFEQATYLPDNIKKFHFALINSTVIVGQRHPAHADLRLADGLHGGAAARRAG